MAKVIQSKEIKKARNPTIKEHGLIEDSVFMQQATYNEDSQQLTITMKNGGQYIYSGIFKSLFDDFLEAPSKDKFYNQMIKGNDGPATKIINKDVGKRVKKL